MRKRTGLACALCLPLLFPRAAQAADRNFDQCIRQFGYDTRLEMKIGSEQLLDLLENGKAVLVDIRCREEQQAWGMGFALRIPLNELPNRLADLPKEKLIVTACPPRDRAIIAMSDLWSKGIPARYLTDGLIGLAERLRGNDALYFPRLFDEMP